MKNNDEGQKNSKKKGITFKASSSQMMIVTKKWISSQKGLTKCSRDDNFQEGKEKEILAKKINQRRIPSCYECKKVGHVKVECPKLKKDQKMKILKDSRKSSRLEEKVILIYLMTNQENKK